MEKLDLQGKVHRRIFLNSILDFSEERSMRELGLDSIAIESIRKSFSLQSYTSLKIEQELIEIMNAADQMAGLREKYNMFLISSTKYDGDIRKMLDILAFIYKGYVYSKNDRWRDMSEYSIIIKLWSFIFETISEEESNIRLLWGKTKNNKFKVDLRICLYQNNKYYDISNVESKKDGNSSQSIR